MITLLKATGGPGSIPFLVLAVLLGLAIIYIWPRRRRLGALWILAVTASYLVLGLPIVANVISDRLPGVQERTDVHRPFASLIILDGDNRRGRVRLAQQVLASDRPSEVWVLGDEWILDALKEAGVSADAYRLAGGAATTFEQMQQVSRLVAALPAGRFAALITSRLQAPRVAALAEAQSIPAVIMSAPVDGEPPTTGMRQFVPAYIALRVSRDALYEHAALWWYARQGWIQSPRTGR